MIDIDVTLFFQFINFIITLVVLNYLLIRPIRDIVKKRRDLAAGLLSDAESFTGDAAEKLERYEAALAAARIDAAKIRDERRNAGEAEQENLLRAAQQEAQEFLAASRDDTRKAVAEAMAAIKKRIPDLAAMAAARVLGKKTRSAA